RYGAVTGQRAASENSIRQPTFIFLQLPFQPLRQRPWRENLVEPVRVNILRQPQILQCPDGGNTPADIGPLIFGPDITLPAKLPDWFWLGIPVILLKFLPDLFQRRAREQRPNHGALHFRFGAFWPHPVMAVFIDKGEDAVV